jgi:hypothetical protein
MVRWLEKEGYDVKYATSIDLDSSPGLLTGTKAYLSVGHDEYWTDGMRQSVVAARDGGVNLAFFSANNIYDSSFDNYRETVYWATLGKPAEQIVGMGALGPVVSNNYYPPPKMTVTANGSWVFAGTSLPSSASPVLTGLVGYEADGLDPSSIYNPSTVQILASTDLQTNAGFSNMTVYTASSGAEVFAAGTFQWSWGLDDYNVVGSPPRRTSALSSDVQQSTRNVLAAMRASSSARQIMSVIAPLLLQ